MENRRNFLKGAGLFGAFAAGFAAPVVIEKVREVQLPAPVATSDPKVIKQLEEQGNSHLQLTAAYGEIEPPKPPPVVNGYNFKSTDGSLMFQPVFGTTGSVKSHLTVQEQGNIVMGTNYKKFVEGTEKVVDVKMMPGPDGELYLNVNGQWKKVLTA